MQPPDNDPESPGEWVTRTDGTRALRVRKRRVRAPNEPISGPDVRKQKTKTRLMVGGGVLLLVVAAVAAAIIYPNTAGYRGRISDMAGNATGATVAIRNLAMTPGRAKADHVEMSWPAGHVMATLEATRVTADVSSFRALGGAFGGEELRASTGKLVLRMPGDAAAMPSGSDGRGKVTFNRIGIPKLDAYFGDPADAAPIRLTGTEAAFYPRGPNGLARVLLHAGTLKIPYWPEYTLERALVEFPVGSAEIVNMRIRHARDGGSDGPPPGSCDITGSISHRGGVDSSLALFFDSFQLSELVGPETGRLIGGRVDTRPGSHESLLLMPADGGPPVMRAELVANVNSLIHLQGFPFLHFFSTALGDKWFQSPIFDDSASLTVVRNEAETRIENLELTDTSRMAVRGNLAVDGDNMVSGTLEIGIAPAWIAESPTRRLDGMFSQPRAGFRWITLEIGGTTGTPTDNFNAMFIDTPIPDVDGPVPPAATDDAPPPADDR